MTTATENNTAKAKNTPDFYIFENGDKGQKNGKPAGAAFVHKKGNGFLRRRAQNLLPCLQSLKIKMTQVATLLAALKACAAALAPE